MPKTARHHVTSQDTAKARHLRREMPLAEKLLWVQLRRMPPELNLNFRRQQVIHPYIADFACLKLKLLIELDGMSHDSRQSYDVERDAYLKNRGYAVLRFINDDVIADPVSIVETIIAYVRIHGLA